MSTRRAVLGALPGGGFGLRVSLPGFDVLADDPTDVSKFSFNSDWTDLLRTHQYGFVATNQTVPFPELGYYPFIEVRQVSPSDAYDDRPTNISGARWATQAACTVTTHGFTITNYAPPASAYYIVFKEPAS